MRNEITVPGKPDICPCTALAKEYFEAVQTRIYYKMQDFATYDFSGKQSCALNIFFDLAQEFEDIEYLYTLAVQVPFIFFKVNSELYTKNDQGNLILRTAKLPGLPETTPPLTPSVNERHGSLFLPVRGKYSSGAPGAQNPDDLLGVLVVRLGDTPPRSGDEGINRLFLEKYANRVGYALHNKILAQRNHRHVHFLKNLAHDIGHNVTTPNMRFKLLLLQLEQHIGLLGNILSDEKPEAAIEQSSLLQRKMLSLAQAAMGQFRNNALFLESLLRQSHFDLGHYSLHIARFDLCKSVVKPQFDRFRPNFDERGIQVSEGQSHLPDTPCMVLADVGLISQALANLLGNAAKYSSSVDRYPPWVGCGVDIIKGAFPHGTPGVKVSVRSSGPSLPDEEKARLFENHYRGANAGGEHGTGHGLFFVREIVAEHNGRTGYERGDGVNVFYFLLPLAPEVDG